MGQEMVASISDVFGGGTADTIFSIGLSGGGNEGQQAAKVAVDAAKAEINRIRGYKPRLTPAESERLSKIQEQITALDSKARDGTIRPDEIENRSELFKEADTIIGKPSAEVEADETLEGYREEIDALLAPKLDGAKKRRLNTLENLKANLEDQIGGGDDSAITRGRLINANKQINDITPPRRVQDLSVREKTEYDRLVKQVNDYAGAKLVLDVREASRVYTLQQNIDNLSGSLPPDPSTQPTSASVARAYARFT